MQLREGTLDLDQAKGGEAQATTLEAPKELSRDAALHRVRLQNDQGALNDLRHEAFSIFKGSVNSSAASGAASSAIVARGPTAAR